MKKLKKLLVLVIPIAAITAIAPSVSNSAELSVRPKPPCRIQIGQPHISSWALAKYGHRAVKVNAFSKCNVPQSKVTLTVEIWKEATFGNTLVARTVVKSPRVTPPGGKVENLKTLRRCESYEETKYYGIAYAKAFIQGKWQIARDTYSLNIKPLACGT
jgi:hypothetical protein